MYERSVLLKKNVIVRVVMDKLYKVYVYEFAKYNDNDKIQFNDHKQYALKKEYTWGIYNS